MLPTVFRSSTTPIESVFNRLVTLDRAFGEDGPGLPSTWSSAPVAIWQDEDHAFVELELPGVSETDLEMTLHRNELTIRAERKAPDGRRYLFCNRAFGKIQRTITLPDDVDGEKVEASFKDGILTVSAPKRPESKPRKLSLTTG